MGALIGRCNNCGKPSVTLGQAPCGNGDIVFVVLCRECKGADGKILFSVNTMKAGTFMDVISDSAEAGIETSKEAIPFLLAMLEKEFGMTLSVTRPQEKPKAEPKPEPEPSDEDLWAEFNYWKEVSEDPLPDEKNGKWWKRRKQ